MIINNTGKITYMSVYYAVTIGIYGLGICKLAPISYAAGHPVRRFSSAGTFKLRFIQVNRGSCDFSVLVVFFGVIRDFFSLKSRIVVVICYTGKLGISM